MSVLWLLSAPAIVAGVHRMDVLDRERHPIHLSWRGSWYWPWPLNEIALANLDVAKAILRLPGGIAPAVFEVRASQKGELGRVIYANPVTLASGP